LSARINQCCQCMRCGIVSATMRQCSSLTLTLPPTTSSKCSYRRELAFSLLETHTHIRTKRRKGQDNQHARVHKEDVGWNTRWVVRGDGGNENEATTTTRRRNGEQETKYALCSVTSILRSLSLSHSPRRPC
jgi:hypothetical protein